MSTDKEIRSSLKSTFTCAPPLGILGHRKRPSENLTSVVINWVACYSGIQARAQAAVSLAKSRPEQLVRLYDFLMHWLVINQFMTRRVLMAGHAMTSVRIWVHRIFLRIDQTFAHCAIPAGVSFKALAASGTTSLQITGLKVRRNESPVPPVTFQNMKMNASYRDVVKAIRDAGKTVDHSFLRFQPIENTRLSRP